jgi:hypothetical protein
MAKRSEKKKNTGLVGIAAGTTTLGLAMQCLPPPTRQQLLGILFLLTIRSVPD